MKKILDLIISLLKNTEDVNLKSYISNYKQKEWGRVRFGAAVSVLDISAPDISAPGPFGARTFFSRFVFLLLRCFGLLLASLAVGLRTLVSTGSRSTAFKKLPASLFFLGPPPEI